MLGITKKPSKNITKHLEVDLGERGRGEDIGSEGGRNEICVNNEFLF